MKYSSLLEANDKIYIWGSTFPKRVSELLAIVEFFNFQAF